MIIITGVKKWPSIYAGTVYTARGETLEEVRIDLVQQHEKRNLDATDWQDQICAVYPFDESELDYGEENPTPRPLTIELLIKFAAHTWDVHPNHITVDDSETNK